MTLCVAIRHELRSFPSKYIIKSMKNAKKVLQMYFLHLYISSTFFLRRPIAKRLKNNVLYKYWIHIRPLSDLFSEFWMPFLSNFAPESLKG